MAQMKTTEHTATTPPTTAAIPMISETPEARLQRRAKTLTRLQMRAKEARSGEMNRAAVDAFIYEVGNARELVTLLRRFLDEHMDLVPEDVHWGHVGDAGRIRTALQELATTFNLQ